MGGGGGRGQIRGAHGALCDGVDARSPARDLGPTDLRYRCRCRCRCTRRAVRRPGLRVRPMPTGERRKSPVRSRLATSHRNASTSVSSSEVLKCQSKGCGNQRISPTIPCAPQVGASAVQEGVRVVAGSSTTLPLDQSTQARRGRAAATRRRHQRLRHLTVVQSAAIGRAAARARTTASVNPGCARVAARISRLRDRGGSSPQTAGIARESVLELDGAIHGRRTDRWRPAPPACRWTTTSRRHAIGPILLANSPAHA